MPGQAAYRPIRTASAEAGLRLGRARVELRARHVGSRRSSIGSDVNLLAAHTRVALGLRAERAVVLGGERLQARLDVSADNLLDEEASLLVDYPLPGRTFTVLLGLRRGR